MTKTSRVSVTHLSALVCDQRSERLGVEAAVAEAQATVHAVGGQLQSLLTDVVLVETQISVGLHRHMMMIKFYTHFVPTRINTVWVLYAGVTLHQNGNG